LNVLAGVDEAGLGPILGPLVVAGVALSGPEGADAWQLLADVISRERTEKGKVRVADSKKVNQGQRGLQRLEETALAFWGARHGALPADLQSLLETCGVDLAPLQRCPWYEDLRLPLPLRADAGLVELTAARLERALAKAGIELRALAVRPVDVEEFNRWIDATDNKSRAHFRAYARVIAELLAVLPAGSHLVADRCGGLVHYVPSLRRAYPKVRVRVLAEGPALSSYEVATRAGPVRVTFAAQGEDHAFPTALASCIAKYVRELMICLLNRWFEARVPGLRPTAGYYTDGRRFLADVGAIVAQEGFPRRRLIRSR
jgi:ribonuclease HII